MINGTMMQFFHWYSPGDGTLWDRVAADAASLAAAGITALWLPPAGKGSGGAQDRGYGVYDPWDLGEFDQKGTVRTRYGTRAQFEQAVNAAHQAHLQVYTDVVFNHKNGADELEDVRATPVHWDRRNDPAGPPRTIRAWTKFTFPGRGTNLSGMKWNSTHFDAVSWDENAPPDEKGKYLYRIKDKNFDTPVDPTHQSFDYLMCCDLDLDQAEVREELKHWGEWMVNDLHVDGFRMDAVKHVRFFFLMDWLDHLRALTGKELFTVGEYWEDWDLSRLESFLHLTRHTMSVFDTILRHRFHQASHSQWGGYDLGGLLHGTVTEHVPTHAVSYVENHDTQVGRHSAFVQDWFKPLAYALILLREQGYPCIFSADYYGASYTIDGTQHTITSHRFLLDRFLQARRQFAFGPQIDYFDHSNVVGWTRLGDSQHPGGMAVLLSDGPGGSKWMNVGHPHARYRDLTEHLIDTVQANADGWAEFRCPGGQPSVWVPVGA